jgi:site-specific recombinase XerD
MGKTERLDPVLESYLEYLADVSKKKPGTVKDVRCTLKRVSKAMGTHGRPLWKLELSDYVVWLEQERQFASSTSCCKFVSHIRCFLDYAWRGGKCNRNVLDGFHLQDSTSRKSPAVLTLQEAARLIETAPSERFIDKRNRLIILLLYGCGLRTGEICNLNIQDMDTENWNLFIRQGKGDVQRVIPIPGGIHGDILGYLLARRSQRGPMFRTEMKNRRIRVSDVSKVMKEAVRRADIPWKVTAKTLRHTYATHLMDQGVDIAVISSLMGHRGPAETGVYLHVLSHPPQDAVKKLETNGGEQK